MNKGGTAEFSPFAFCEGRFLSHRVLRSLWDKKCSAGCARRNKVILPLCGIAAALKVFKPFRLERRNGLRWACPLCSGSVKIP